MEHTANLPVRQTLVYDVAVFGAGPAGIAAACTAAADGLRTLLVEPSRKIGGVMSTCPGMMLGAGYPMGKSIGGFFEEFVGRLYRSNPPRAEKRSCRIPEFGPEVVYDHEYALTELYSMLNEAGVRLCLGMLPLCVRASEDRIQEVLLASRDGIDRLQAKIYLDCTGDGDIAAAAGVPCRIGNRKGQMMGGTMTFFMENVDWDRAFSCQDLYYTEYARKGIREGRLHPDITEIYFLKGLYPGTVFFNTVTLSGVDGLNGQNLQQLSQEARRRCLGLAEFCRSDLPGFENAHLTQMGPLLGVRETRKLEAMHCLTIGEIAAETKFPDGIVACDNPIDDVFRGEAKSFSNDRALREGAYYTIPFRCLVPQKLQNLLFAGRCICADDSAFASVRGMPQCMIMGQSIAAAAGMAIRQQQSVQQIDPLHVVESLVVRGVKGIGESPL